MVLADIGNGDVLIWMIEFFFLVIILWIVFGIIGDIMRSDDLSGGSKAFWCLFIIVVPWLAIFIYLIVRGSGMTERAMAAQAKAQAQYAQYAQNVASSTGATGEIASAKALLDSGAITQADFEELKAKALAKA